MSAIIAGIQVGLVVIWREYFSIFNEGLNLLDMAFFLIGTLVVFGGMQILKSVVWNDLIIENDELDKQNNILSHVNKVTTQGLSKMTEARDMQTSLQIRRIGDMSARIAEELWQSPKFEKYLSADYIEDLRVAAPLYDLGRVGLSDSLLEKGVGLTQTEFDEMKTHVLIGGDLISELQKALPYRTYFSLAKEIIYHHHQCWDGTGYPNVLKNGDNVSYFVYQDLGNPLAGEDIPLSARIVAVTDVYNALINYKPWRKAFSHEEACALIEEGREHQFDPNVVDAFLRCRADIREIAEEH